MFFIIYYIKVDNDEDAMGAKINTFWSEFEDFQSISGNTYAGREYIFKGHKDILEGRVFIWHKKETLRYTKEFGKFACRVTSKILGIGSAERSWGDVKHLKTNKRSHLSGERVKKQATIYGASCIEQAWLLRSKESEDVTTTPIKYFRDDDFDNMLDEEKEENNTKKPPRVFKAFIEDWEQEAIYKRDPVNEAKLLKKYGGLSWNDPDNDNAVLTAHGKTMHWARVTKSGGGYCVVACDMEYSEDDDNNHKHTEPWEITNDLIDCITEYYKIHTHDGVTVEMNTENSDKPASDDDNDNENSSGSSTDTE
jgi:hypothetical protein